jgi:hypothetical protein
MRISAILGGWRQSFLTGLMVLGLLLTPAAAAGDAPRIVFDKTDHDFGDIAPNQEYVYRFVFRNEGEGTLKIGNIRTTCGCTVVEPARKILEPGQSSDLEVRYRTSRQPGDPVKKIIVQTNDPGQPEVTLSVHGQIETDLEYSPYSVRWDRQPLDQPAEAEVFFRPDDPDSFRITAVKPGAEWLTAQADPLPDGRTRLVVRYVPGRVGDADGEMLNAFVRLETTSSSYPQVQLPVYLRVLKEYAAIPPRLFLYARQGEDVQRDIIIKNNKGRRFTITGATSSQAEISVTITKNGEVANMVRVHAAAAAATGYKTGEILVRVGEETVAIPLRLSIMEKDADLSGTSERSKTKGRK